MKPEKERLKFQPIRDRYVLGILSGVLGIDKLIRRNLVDDYRLKTHAAIERRRLYELGRLDAPKCDLWDIRDELTTLRASAPAEFDEEVGESCGLQRLEAIKNTIRLYERAGVNGQTQSNLETEARVFGLILEVLNTAESNYENC